MNDESVVALWDAMKRLRGRIEVIELRLETMDARIRARLKEEADAAKL